VKLFTIIDQVTPSVYSFSECLELFLDFRHIFISFSDVILLAVTDVRPRKPISLSYL